MHYLCVYPIYVHTRYSQNESEKNGMSRVLFGLLAACLLLTGCVKQQILDRINLFIVSAFDESTKNQIEITLAVPKFQSGKPGSVSTELFSKVGHTSLGIRELMSMQLDRPLNPGKLSVVLYGKDMAANGLAKELDVFLRNAFFSRRMYLAVVDGSAKKLLEENFSSKEEKGMFLYNLLDTTTRKGLLPSQNLHEFEYSLIGKGMDPFLPLLKLQNGQVMISGTALFKNDKYVVSLNEKQSRLMKLLLTNMNHGTIEVKLDDESYLAVENIGSKVSYRINPDPKSPNVMINLVLNAKIRDAREVRLPKQELQRIKDSLENDLHTTGLDLIKLFKKEGIDPLGLGDFVRSKTRNWNEEEWKKVYPTMNVGLYVKVNLTETGIKK
ncbi:Ger(x)C family spore germination protein [Paenibacillus sp. Root444D2]|uniref:Ger(x)C family spore germination protein n=1 Tax=Paenibacillus sp. Root444D2 TaxID=1736538 RepID=UPI0009E933EA|nr:Ger(x)C family spore germination protein [Paenibacillus sp. Root444D2]